jgi:hypothetical protein
LTIDVAALPRLVIPAGTLLYRLHRTRYGAWYFSGDGSGRFDPAGTSGAGMCYLAMDPRGAWVETFRTMMTINEIDVNERALSIVTTDRPFALANLEDRKALRAGVTAALTSGADYESSHAVADALQGVVQGIRWRARHDLEQVLITVGLFGPEGGQPATDWPPTRSDQIPAGLIRDVEDQFGYRVVPSP